MTFTSHAMAVRSVAWSPDSTVCHHKLKGAYLINVLQLLLSASEDKRLVLHDVRTAPGGAVASFSGHSSWVLSTDISPDSRLGLSGYVFVSLAANLILLGTIPDRRTRALKFGILAHAPQFQPFKIPVKYGASVGDQNFLLLGVLVPL